MERTHAHLKKAEKFIRDNPDDNRSRYFKALVSKYRTVQDANPHFADEIAQVMNNAIETVNNGTDEKNDMSWYSSLDDYLPSTVVDVSYKPSLSLDNSKRHDVLDGSNMTFKKMYKILHTTSTTVAHFYFGSDVNHQLEMMGYYADQVKKIDSVTEYSKTLSDSKKDSMRRNAIRLFTKCFNSVRHSINCGALEKKRTSRKSNRYHMRARINREISSM